jgi:malonyl-CoA O-methyltransferase
MSSARAAYEVWADSYPAVAHNPLMRLEQDIVSSILARVRAKRALDVGTGSGRYLPLLARTAATVIGVDFSMAMLRSADRGVCVCADAGALPFPRRSFDLINASLMVGDVGDLGEWTREMARVLTRGGRLVYSDFHESWAQHGWKRTFRAADGTPHHLGFIAHRVDDHLEALRAAGFRVLAIREPRFRDDADPQVRAFRRRWGNPPVIAIFHAVRDT